MMEMQVLGLPPAEQGSSHFISFRSENGDLLFHRILQLSLAVEGASQHWLKSNKKNTKTLENSVIAARRGHSLRNPSLPAPPPPPSPPLADFCYAFFSFKR